jgi:hypothetical protein
MSRPPSKMFYTMSKTVLHIKQELIVAELAKIFPGLVWNLKAHYHVHKNQSQV